MFYESPAWLRRYSSASSHTTPISSSDMVTVVIAHFVTEEVTGKVQESTAMPTPGVTGPRQHVLVLGFSRPPIGDLGFFFFLSFSGARSLDTFTYDDKAGEHRRNFVWIIGEDEITLNKGTLVDASSVTLEVVVPEYDAPTYATSRNFGQV
ncbi:hypothetical protein VM1G_08920 [Cytospora mali]|uniref:Uncharacterized protein n=1 Tax=Cytospora mali TaxID=578113 RepID=A0A194WAU6_CYTMA|nr:hypothetical protein VM1G_08920 [Valsa mali]